MKKIWKLVSDKEEKESYKCSEKENKDRNFFLPKRRQEFEYVTYIPKPMIMNVLTVIMWSLEQIFCKK